MTQPITTQPNMVRPIYEIASEIHCLWIKQGRYITPSARPYLDAMGRLNSVTDSYGADSAESIILYFLSNASSFRGEDARRLKAELKALLAGLHSPTR